MAVFAHLLTYAALLVFAVAVLARFIQIQSYPINMRWELYPVPHEGERAKHGGSKLEEVDWWTKPRTRDLLMEARFMIAEMLFLKALYEHNRKLWYWSFPFHLGLYQCAKLAAWLLLGAILSMAGVPMAAGSGWVAMVWLVIAYIIATVALTLGIIGGVGLLARRLTDPEMKPYTTFSHVFNLAFIVLTLAVTAIAWLAADPDFAAFRGFVESLLRLNVAAPVGGFWVGAAIVLVSLLLAYIPLTHMSHFFVKWFTWHRIRWDDEPNVKGGRIELMIQKALQYPVSWSAPHINADGKKSWAQIATEEIKR